MVLETPPYYACTDNLKDLYQCYLQCGRTINQLRNHLIWAVYGLFTYNLTTCRHCISMTWDGKEELFLCLVKGNFPLINF